MVEKLRLRREGSKRVKLHPAVLAVVVIVALLVGFFIGQKGLISVKASENCIPQTDFQDFLDQANEVRAEYQKCVADLWALQFSYKTGGKITPSGQPANTTNSSN